MDLTQGLFTEIYTMDHEIGYWLKGASPKDVKETLNGLREGLIDLNKIYQNPNNSRVIKSFATANFFTPERVTIIKELNTRISALHREDFEAWVTDGMERAGKIARKRLLLLHQNIDIFSNHPNPYTRDRDELHQQLLYFTGTFFMDWAFFRWRAFDLMLNQDEKEWCFVFTEPFNYISILLLEFTERKPDKITRSLEYAFRKLLGDYTTPYQRKQPFDKNFGWTVDRRGRESLVTRFDMERNFKSYREI